MIITNSQDRPSQRFIDIIKDTMISDGFIFKKTSKTFYRETETGFETVSTKFYTTVNLVSVSIAWSKSVFKLEKLFFLWDGKKNFKKETTCYADLSNFTRFTPNRNHTWDLFNIQNYKCDDFVLNKASSEFLNAYETTVLPFFKDVDDYCKFEKIVNKLPISYLPFSTGQLGYTKQFALGLCLASYCEHEDFEKLVEKMLQFTYTTIHKSLQDETVSVISKTVQFLKEQNIKSLL